MTLVTSLRSTPSVLTSAYCPTARVIPAAHASPSSPSHTPLTFLLPSPYDATATLHTSTYIHRLQVHICQPEMENERSLVSSCAGRHDASQHVLAMVVVLPDSPDTIRRLPNHPSVNPAAPISHSFLSSNASRAIVTTLYNDLYTTPVANLGHSLNAVDAYARRILLYIPGRLSERSMCIARAVGWELHAVPFIPPPHDGKGIHYRFVDQYTKLNLWKLDQLGIERAVYLDADTLVLRNFDELFDIPFAFAAVPDVWDVQFLLGFNAGVLVLRPSTDVFAHMMATLGEARFPLKDAEQAFLNLYFGADVVRLPYVYNGNLVIKERSPVMWQAMHDSVKIVHYTVPKPFPKVGKGIVEGDRLRKAIRKARNARGGLFREEIGWWERSYNDMQIEHRDALSKCDWIVDGAIES
ncbi:nucleotide-diphospho-sugar transferase [Artomyces pyxidatus]|uniref:Nucleotide-diphospho-sugar transferase n=1 Tax=Artomyces pyxidatus TaxID=48021 RepID=A0ACB8T728_9AGAM|nr:nucleotide-diphospho-sugar transferase [Artomyces pyxidatus]